MPIVIPEGAAFLGNQVPVQRPSLSDSSVRAGSPFEKVASTDPAVMGSPQSSMTFISKGSGTPASAINPGESWVNTPRKTPARQLLPAARSPTFATAWPAPPGGATTSNTFTLRESYSLNINVIAPL